MCLLLPSKANQEEGWGLETPRKQRRESAREISGPQQCGRSPEPRRKTVRTGPLCCAWTDSRSSNMCIQFCFPLLQHSPSLLLLLVALHSGKSINTSRVHCKGCAQHREAAPQNGKAFWRQKKTITREALSRHIPSRRRMCSHFQRTPLKNDRTPHACRRFGLL